MKTAISVGYWFTTAPQFYNGMLYIGSTRSESHIPGGHVLAVDAKTGKVIWHFNTIPQDEKDQGWEIAGPTWVGGERNGGGIWETAAIDPQLGLLYMPVGNPFGDSTKRAGIEPLHRFDHRAHARHGDAEVVLPADAPRRLGLRLRRAADSVRHAGARTAREGARRRQQERLPVHPQSRDGTARASDQGNAGADDGCSSRRATVADAADSVHGERQADGAGLSRRSAGHSAEQLEKNKIVPQYTPAGPNQIHAPGTGGGSNYSPISYSPQTGLLYVAAIDSPTNPGRGPKGYFSAYDPTTGELVWRQIFEGYGQAGSVVTAGGLVFVGTGSNIAGYFFAFDAKTGELLWKFNTGAGVFSSPSIYMVNGEQFVTVASGGGDRGRRGGDLILSFALPKS